MLFSRRPRRSPWDLRCQEETSSCLRTCQAKGLEQRLGFSAFLAWGFEACRLEAFEEHYGMVRAQKVPCDGSIQVEDVSLELDFNESTIYRSLVGMPIYPSQERLDTSFTSKELASKTSKPTITAMSRLKKRLGYLTQTMGYSMKLRIPEHGQGSRCSTSCGYVLESYSYSDWAGNKDTTRSPCGSKKSDRSFAKKHSQITIKKSPLQDVEPAKLPTKYASKISTFWCLKTVPTPLHFVEETWGGIFWWGNVSSQTFW